MEIYKIFKGYELSEYTIMIFWNTTSLSLGI